MAATYTPIASITLDANASTVTFSSIPQTYTDLVLVINGRTDTDENVSLRINGDTGNNYSETTLYGTGSASVSTRTTNANTIGIGGISSGTDEQGTNIVHFFNYANTTTNKSIISRANNSTYVQIRVGVRRNTEAISSFSLTAATSTFLTGATFNLYGILGANA